ncbi:MAG: YiiX/YebB-like N1pC/P60 family cysteine hydrolase [Salibacteraceae bacterium]
MKVFLHFFCVLSLLVSCSPKSGFELQEGDILFQDIDCGIYCESIESVTRGYQGANLSHCGIVTIKDNKAFVLEAISKGVSLTPLDSFLNRSFDENNQPKVFVGRVSGLQMATESVLIAEKKMGKPYDSKYDITDDTYYCSELVYYSFLRNGEPIFKLNPMTFKALNTDSTFAAWEGYFADLNVPIPEGEPGLNPGGISLSKEIEVVHFYGKPSGMQ